MIEWKLFVWLEKSRCALPCFYVLIVSLKCARSSKRSCLIRLKIKLIVIIHEIQIEHGVKLFTCCIFHSHKIKYRINFKIFSFIFFSILNILFDNKILLLLNKILSETKRKYWRMKKYHNFFLEPSDGDQDFVIKTYVKLVQYKSLLNIKISLIQASFSNFFK